jgi:transcriptional regulator with XRE-family HTH domain
MNALPPTDDTPDPYLHQVGARIRQLRELLELNQDVFAAYTGMHRSYVGQIEHGRRDLRLGTLRRIAGLCGLEVHQLLDPGFVLQPSLRTRVDHEKLTSTGGLRSSP